MKSYPSYKDSGVEWIGEIPRGWDVSPLKWYSELVTDGSHFSPTSTDEGKYYITVSDVTEKRNINFNGCKKISDESFENLKRNGCQPTKGDVLITKDGTIGRGLVVDNNDFVILSSLGLIRTKKERVKPNYLLHFLLSGLCIDQMYSHIRGSGITRLTITLISNLLCVLPPLPEQQQISNYLDQKTKQIDDLIEKTEQKIELLKEKRTSLINHCVTKGLDPDVEMKDSGVEWIGEIPKEWVTRKFKYVISNKLDNGIFKKKVDFGEGVRLVNVGDLFNEGNVISQHTLDRVKVDKSEQLKYKVHDNDIFFVRSSLKLEGIGVSSIIGKLNEPTVFECHIIRSIPKSSLVHPYFLKYSLNSYLTRHRIISISQTVTMTTISQDHIKDLEIVCPPLPEQQQIVKHLDKETQKIDTLIEKENKRIELLKEYRQSLISEVVTGKIDVRDEVLQ